MARHKILISACLVGERVRYHGGDSREGHGITTAQLRSEGVRVFSESEIEAAARYLDLLDGQR